VVAQQYHYPYGANRGGAQSDLTERRYTGQYHETGLAGSRDRTCGGRGAVLLQRTVVALACGQR